MAQQHFLANRETEMVLLALQVFQVLFLWVHGWIPLERPYPDWPYDWLVISYACFHRANPRLVDTLSLPTGTEASCSLSNHVRQNAFLLADAQWNGPKHRAYFAPFGDRLQPAVLLLELFHLTGLSLACYSTATICSTEKAPSSCTVSLQISPKTNISTGPEIPEPITGTCTRNRCRIESKKCFGRHERDRKRETQARRLA